MSYNEDSHPMQDMKEISLESCDCSKVDSFISRQHSNLKLKAKENQSVDLLVGKPQIEGKKIKGRLAYAGISLNRRLYLPEELAKGDGMTVPLIINHASIAGAENELYEQRRLSQELVQKLERGEEIPVGEVSLTWSEPELTLYYEGIITDEFFQKELTDGNMSVSLGMYYDANSPKICDVECYTVLKDAEFHEVSLVYNPGFPIATVEAVEALIKKKLLATESLEKIKFTKEDHDLYPFCPHCNKKFENEIDFDNHMRYEEDIMGHESKIENVLFYASEQTGNTLYDVWSTLHVGEVQVGTSQQLIEAKTEEGAREIFLKTRANKKDEIISIHEAVIKKT